MRYRRDIKNTRRDKRIFTRTADGVHKRNYQRTNMRGGIRL